MAASSGAGSSSAAAADSSSVRTIEARDVLDESTHSLVLRVVRDGDGLCDLTLCDGSTTWQGTVDEVSLTPPKMGFSREDFASRLLAGLQGADGSDDTDTFKLEKLPEERRLLIWSAVCRPGTLPVTLQQRMTLLPERSARPGAGLMALLLQLAGESTALQCECRSETERARTLEVEAAELEAVERRLGGAPERLRTELKAHCLGLLNQTKAELMQVESALNAESAGDDGLAGPVSDDEFYKDDEDEEATQRPAPAAASSAAPLTHGGARRGSQGAAATGAPPRCCAAARSQPPTISLHAGGGVLVEANNPGGAAAAAVGAKRPRSSSSSAPAAGGLALPAPPPAGDLLSLLDDD